MLVVGLTGGISSGKSTISSWFLERGIIVLDADQIVRELQKAGSPLLDELAQTFGPTIINENGELVREALATIIFNNENKKAQLNQMIHPLVKNKMIEGIEEARQKGEQLIILDVPLLFESEFESLTDCTLVIYVSQKTQLKRLMKRDGIEEAYALLKINSQMSLEKKRERADYLLINEGSIRELRTKFEEIFETLWARACQTTSRECDK